MRGKILALGIVFLAVGGAGFLGNKVGAFASSGGGCNSSCVAPAQVVNAPSIPSSIIYILLGIGIVIFMIGLAVRGPKRLAT